jgi:cytidine deaminase
MCTLLKESILKLLVRHYIMKESAIIIAIEEAKKSLHSNFKHGAVLTTGKNIISFGHNEDVNRHYIFKSLHAEMSAVKNAKQLKLKKNEKKDLTMVVVRVNKMGLLRHSKPCLHCQQIMKDFGVRKVIYSMDSDHKNIPFGNGLIDYMYL